MLKHFTSRCVRQIKAFIHDQYLVLFFIIALGVKSYVFNTFISKVTWSGQYTFGIICGCFSMAVLFMPLFFIRKYKNLLAIILATFFSILLVIDTVYFSYFASIPTISALSDTGFAKDVGPAIIDLLRWSYLLYFVDILFALVLLKPIKSLAVKLKEKYEIQKSSLKISIFATVLILIAFVSSVLLSGANTLSDVFNKGYDTVSTSQYYGVIMAQIIDTVRIIKQETTSLSASETQNLYDWVKDNMPAQTTNNLTGIANGKNVIMIQVESLGGFVINQKINGKEITPNLNELAKTTNFFQNDRFIIGAGHSADSDFVVSTSYFPLDDAATFVRYGLDDFASLPKTLITNGYSSYAYHGFNRNFWNRNVAFESLGYQKFYAADNYPDGAKINMGLNDGDFLSKTADLIKDQPKPSFSSIITLSSHVPFDITNLTKDLGIDTNDYPNQVGGYLENINYVDRMLGEFFTKLKSLGLYDDSLILVFGDHTPVLPAFTAGTIHYNPDTVQSKEVPLFIKLPNQTAGITYDNKGTSLDITPTIIDLLGVKTNQLMFGKSLFSKDETSYTTCSNQSVIFADLGDCDFSLTTEKNISATIIRYDQFKKLPK